MAVLVNETCAADPTTGTKAGDTAFVTDHLRLQQAASFARGQFHYSTNLSQDFYTSWQGWAGGGTGGESVWFFWGSSSVPGEEGDNTGSYGVVLNEFSDDLEIRFGGTVLIGTEILNLDNSTYRTVAITVAGQNIKVSVNGTQLLDYTDGTVRTLGGNIYGWAGRCGGANNEHRVKQLYVEAPAPVTATFKPKILMF